jgi:peptide chain release factor 3
MTDAAMEAQIARRRTFAIIAHPDAGKTTLTEKLLLHGGVLRLAGAVKAKRGRASTVSDWMEMERERGISITTSVLQFPYGRFQLNLLDTPGHADFSEDTYRTLHAVDGAVMLLDSAKGVESQTKKLFRVCRQRAMPLFTMVNKMDRPGRDPFDLIGEVESVLGIGAYPMTWPVFRDDVFVGVYERETKRVHVFDSSLARSNAAVGAELTEGTVVDIDDPAALATIGEAGMARLREEIGLLDEAGDGFDHARFLAGEVSPMFFGSAMNNFGLKPFLDSFCELMPAPRARSSSIGPIDPVTSGFSGTIFKIQANMDKAHRDRVAFLRVCSGRFERGAKVLHVRTGREMRIANPTQFVANDRVIIEEAFAGDVVGLYDTGVFEIGDTLTDGKSLVYEGIPSFAPEHFARLVPSDPLRRKQLTKGTDQLAQEGTIQLYKPRMGHSGELILGAVGQLQLEVVKYRMASEYDVPVRIESVPYRLVRWVSRVDGAPVDLQVLARKEIGLVATDARDRTVVLFEGEWSLNTALRFYPEYAFAETAFGVVMRHE